MLPQDRSKMLLRARAKTANVCQREGTHRRNISRSTMLTLFAGLRETDALRVALKQKSKPEPRFVVLVALVTPV